MGVTTIDEHVARVRSIVARYSLAGPLPAEFVVYSDDLERGAIVRAKMLRIDSRRDGKPEDLIIGTTAKEVFLLGESDAQIHERFVSFALGLYEHEFYEWLRLDGDLVSDPHAEDGAL